VSPCSRDPPSGGSPLEAAGAPADGGADGAGAGAKGRVGTVPGASFSGLWMFRWTGAAGAGGAGGAGFGGTGVGGAGVGGATGAGGVGLVSGRGGGAAKGFTTVGGVGAGLGATGVGLGGVGVGGGGVGGAGVGSGGLGFGGWGVAGWGLAGSGFNGGRRSMTTGGGGCSGIGMICTSIGGAIASGNWYSGAAWVRIRASTTTWNVVESASATILVRRFFRAALFKGCTFLPGPCRSLEALAAREGGFVAPPHWRPAGTDVPDYARHNP